MGLFDNFKKKENDNTTQNINEIHTAIQSTCANLTLYCRDADLPYDITHKYRTGMIIRERGFVDTTALVGGIITTHRYLILSNHMAPMFQFEGDKQWALCVANKDSRFLVLGRAKVESRGKRVTVLLHLNNDNWEAFKCIDMSPFQKLRDQCYDNFIQCIDKEPIASVSTNEWLARCQFPIGMSDDGTFFPVND